MIRPTIDRAKDLEEANAIIQVLREELAAVAVAIGRSKDGTGYDTDWFELHKDVERLTADGHRRDKFRCGRCSGTGIDAQAERNYEFSRDMGDR